MEERQVFSWSFRWNGSSGLSSSSSVIIFFISTWTTLLSCIEAFPSGAPLSACSHLMPVHMNGELMETASPYLLLLNGTEYGSQPLKLTVTTIGPGARNFMAFMLQARSEFGQPVGRFSTVDLPGASKTMTCYGQDDTLTHTAAFIRPAMEIIWHPPGKNVGRISITGSVAVSKDNFWAVRSEPLKGTGKLDLSASRAPVNVPDNSATSSLHSYRFIWVPILAFIMAFVIS